MRPPRVVGRIGSGPRLIAMVRPQPILLCLGIPVGTLREASAARGVLVLSRRLKSIGNGCMECTLTGGGMAKPRDRDNGRPPGTWGDDFLAVSR